MLNLNLFMALSLSGLNILASAQAPIQPDTNMPDGYQPGLATQDHEPVGQQSICTTNCHPAGNPFTSTWGPDHLPPGVFAAAINGVLGGAPDDCAPCGSCYSLISTGNPYCDPTHPDPNNPACKKYTGDVQQVGPKEIKVLITNHCPDCDDVAGHFDINQEPNKVGWNNPKIFWKKLDYTECM